MSSRHRLGMKRNMATPMVWRQNRIKMKVKNLRGGQQNSHDPAVCL